MNFGHLYLLLFSTLCTLSPTAQGSYAPPLFTLDLSLPPSQRWKGAVALATHNRTWEESWHSIFDYHNQTLFNRLTTDNWSSLGEAVATHYPQQAQELTTIAHEFNLLFPQQLVTYNYLAGWVYYHELAHTELQGNNLEWRECTGVLAQTTSTPSTQSTSTPSTQSVFHVANMDQSPTAVRNVTLHVQFINGTDPNKNSVLFQGVDFYWFTTGLSRMVLKNHVSVQENWRTSLPPLASSTVLKDIRVGVVPQMFVFRRTMERIVSQRAEHLLQHPSATHSSAWAAPSFDDIVLEWSTVLLAAPFYVVMGGVNAGEGAIIARNQTGVAAPGGKVLRFQGNTAGSGSMEYLVQTNYDHWVPDSVVDPRRTAAEDMLSAASTASTATQSVVGMNIELFAVASTYPVHNPHTAYTALMNAKEGTLLPYVRIAMCPLFAESTYPDERYCKSKEVL